MHKTKYCIVTEGNLTLFHIQSFEEDNHRGVVIKVVISVSKVLVMSQLQFNKPKDQTYKLYSMEEVGVKYFLFFYISLQFEQYRLETVKTLTV